MEAINKRIQILQEKELNYPHAGVGNEDSDDDEEDPAGFHSNMNDPDHRRNMM